MALVFSGKKPYSAEKLSIIKDQHFKCMSMLQKDTVWDIFSMSNDFEGFAKQATVLFSFKSEVNGSIITCFEGVRKLYHHSFYEYKFVDYAIAQAMFNFETSLGIRYEELNGVKMADPGLANLMNYFNRNGYFEINHQEYITMVRQVRNKFAHPGRDTVAGQFTIHWIKNVIDLINDTYECNNLREERLKLHNQWSEHLVELLKQGAIYETEDYTIPLMLGEIGFINNKVSPMKIEVFLARRVELPEDYHQNEGAYNYEMEELTCAQIETGNGFMKIMDEKGNTIGTIKQVNRREKEEHLSIIEKINHFKNMWVYEHIFHVHVTRRYTAARQQFHHI